jgi:hypothetical protein
MTLTAITRGRGTAVVGNSVPLELIAPVHGLRIRRRWDAVHVDWIWPPGVHEARLRWSTPAGEGGERVLSRRAFLDEGGVTLQTGPSAVSISVETLVRQNHRELVSAPVAGQVSARRPRVRWRLDRGRLRRRIDLVLLADQTCDLPPTVLRTPDTPESLALPARSLIAGTSTVVDVTRGVPPGPLEKVTYALADPGDPVVVLVPWTGGPRDVPVGGGRR